MSGSDVIVIGGGLAGLCSAHALSAAGCTVQLLERRENVAQETSFANGGLLTPSMPEPWNAPGVHWQLLRWLGREEAPMLLRPSAIGEYLTWGVRFLAASSASAYRAATQANYHLCAYSLECLRAWRAALRLEYAAGTGGTLKIYRSARAFEQALAQVEPLRQLGLACEPLDVAAAVHLEPLLEETRDALAGAIHHPADETGDAWLFCQALRERLVQHGVSIRLNCAAHALRIAAGQVTGVETAAGFVAGSKVVLAAGPWSRRLLAPYGVALAVRPVKGYSISIGGLPPRLMPALALVDDSLHAVMTPLGATLRLAGTAEFSGWDETLHPGRIQALWRLLRALSPTLSLRVDRSKAQPWCGLRPVAADGKPYIGATPIAGLYVNTGHGHLGWTQAAGSASLLAQLITAAPTAIDAAPFAVAGVARNRSS
jgi:D-amino-acid dehydrogenase